MNREVICYSDDDYGQTAIENINGYCCNRSAQVIQIQVIMVDGKATIYAVIDYDARLN